MSPYYKILRTAHGWSVVAVSRLTGAVLAVVASAPTLILARAMARACNAV